MTTKRARHTGTITKRGNSYRIRYYIEPGPDGKSRQATETVRGNKKEAEKILRDRITSVEQGNYISADTQNVSEFMDYWLQTYAATNTTVRTQQGYRQKINGYIKPALGGVTLQNLRPQHIQKLYADMLERDLSSRTVLHTHRILRQSLSHAVRWGLILRNPAVATTPPRPEAKELSTWDTDTVRVFLQAAHDSPHVDYYHLGILTGMRRSELSGLKWDSVDLDSKRLSVVRTLQRINGQGLVEGQPKTQKSRRSIKLNASAVLLLRGIRKHQNEQRLAAGPVWADTGYVFTRDDGNPIDPDRLTHDFQNIVRKEGLPHLTLHGLRHAHATMLLSAGIHHKIVSERLGHSTVAVTMDTYSHVLPDMQDQAAEAIEKMLGS